MVLVPSLILFIRFLAIFPLPMEENVAVYPSLASLPKESRSWSIYPEDFYEGGDYVRLPFGRVCPLVFVGGEEYATQTYLPAG